MHLVSAEKPRLLKADAVLVFVAGIAALVARLAPASDASPLVFPRTAPSSARFVGVFAV